MNIKTILLAAAVALSGMTAAPALAMDASQLGRWHCSTGDFGERKCRDDSSVYIEKKKAQREYEEKILPILKKEKYPGRLVFKDPEEYRIGKLGWNSTRRDCHRLKPGEYNRDNRVNTAKAIYCQVKKAGYPIPKPEIVKGW